MLFPFQSNQQNCPFAVYPNFTSLADGPRQRHGGWDGMGQGSVTFLMNRLHPRGCAVLFFVFLVSVYARMCVVPRVCVSLGIRVWKRSYQELFAQLWQLDRLVHAIVRTITALLIKIGVIAGNLVVTDVAADTVEWLNCIVVLVASFVAILAAALWAAPLTEKWTMQMLASSWFVSRCCLSRLKANENLSGPQLTRWLLICLLRVYR